MNQVIVNLPLCFDALEYMDRQLGGAWRVRSALTNMAVWAANSVIYASGQDDGQRAFTEKVKLSTIRHLLRDVESSGIQLDLTSTAVRKTLGIDRSDPHADAVRIARQKCLAARSPARFKEHYATALAVAQERMATREGNVEEIASMLSDNGWALDGYFFDSNGVETCYENEFVEDTALYDESLIDDVLDRFSETLANVLETAMMEIERRYGAAITTKSITVLTAHKQAIERMMDIVGIDKVKLAERNAKLEALVAEQVDAVQQTAESIDAAIDMAVTELSAPEAVEAAPAPRESRMYRVRMDEANEAAQARAAEDAAAAAAKRSAAAKKAAATRKANKVTA